MNTAVFLASLESSAVMGLDDLNYYSICDYSEAAEEEEVTKDIVEEVVPMEMCIVILARSRRTH